MPLATAHDLKHARRILVHGVSGSGKSTAADRIGAALGLPVHLADEEIGFLPAAEAVWTNREPDDMRRIAAQIAAGDRWVLDTTYDSFRDVVMARVDVVIGLDYPRWRSLARLSRRTAGRIRDGRLVCNGNRENLTNLFSRESIIAWHFKTFSQRRATMHAWAENPAGPPTILVSRPAEFDALIEAID